MRQSKRWSFYESIANLVVGQIIAFTAQVITFAALNLEVTWTQNLLIAVIFMVISIARSYTLRRIFNWIGR